MPSHNEQLRAAAAGLQNRVSGKMGGIWWVFLLRGLLALGLGVSTLIWPKLTLALLIRLVGLYAVLDGAAGIVSGSAGTPHVERRTQHERVAPRANNSVPTMSGIEMLFLQARSTRPVPF
jgi:hypothetical protein